MKVRNILLNCVEVRMLLEYILEYSKSTNNKEPVTLLWKMQCFTQCSYITILTLETCAPLVIMMDKPHLAVC